MELIILNNSDRENLNRFISNSEHSVFHQSWEWGDFQESVGNKVFRIGIEDNGTMITAATIIKKILPLGMSYFYCPRAPIFDFPCPSGRRGFPISDMNFDEIWNFFIEKVAELASQEKAIFLRIEPGNELYSKIENRKSKIVNTIDVQPSKTSILDLSKSEDELLEAMHQKTRYNIRLAEKKGLRIKFAGNSFEKFWRLMADTRERDAFRLHARGYYEKMLEGRIEAVDELKKDKLGLMLAGIFWDSNLLASNIVSFFGDTVTYVHGASSNEHRNMMAPYLLQWQTIKQAKERGYRYYDLNGTDEKKWPGVTRFKRGFGGSEAVFPGTFDLVLDRVRYPVYKALRKLRRMV